MTKKQKRGRAVMIVLREKDAELIARLDKFVAAQMIPPPHTAVLRVALERFLTKEGF